MENEKRLKAEISAKAGSNAFTLSPKRWIESTEPIYITKNGY